MVDLHSIVGDLRNRIDEVEVSRLRRSDAQVLSLFKEAISLLHDVTSKAGCLLNHSNVKNVGAICSRKWIASIADQKIYSVTKLTRGIGFSIDLVERSVKIFNRGYLMIFGRDRIIVVTPVRELEINLRNLEGVSEHLPLISKTFSYTVEMLRKADEDFSRCIKYERIRC